MLETFICSYCGGEHPIADRITFDGRTLCRSCHNERTCVCERCGERIWADNDYGDATHTLCQDCEESYYDHCADCGRLVEYGDLCYLEDDDDEGYCDTCYSRHILPH